MEAENARDAMVKEAIQQAHERMRRHREGVEAQEKRTAWRARGRSRGGARTLSSAAAAEQTAAVGTATNDDEDEAAAAAAAAAAAPEEEFEPRRYPERTSNLLNRLKSFTRSTSGRQWKSDSKKATRGGGGGGGGTGDGGGRNERELGGASDHTVRPDVNRTAMTVDDTPSNSAGSRGSEEGPVWANRSPRERVVTFSEAINPLARDSSAESGGIPMHVSVSL